ncbi:hypothetical protein LPB140_01185 [Sphingorhabdus lutea]|uniref:TonB-dependent receptor n=1 Tax=Sphingorhabdus lutea TaxID=1913578 RepID=A0A1L3J979_9SPHN|nr:hypothetical protein [Sphingorhabdus lutea]APG61677.1 hypothetical protein LPB140_01185 [Sphingorhabdus lutea]
MKNILENKMNNSNKQNNNPNIWALRSSMLAVAVAATPAAAYANDDVADGVSANGQEQSQIIDMSAVAGTYEKNGTIFVAGTGENEPKLYKNVPVKSAVNTSSIAIAAATSPAPEKQSVKARTDKHDIKFRADTLVVTPILNIGMMNSERTAAAGETINFLGYSNYPAFIEKGEVRIFRATQSTDSEPVAIISVDENGSASWNVPDNSPSALYYIYRIYGANGKFDETTPQELTIVENSMALKKAQEPVSRPNFGNVDEAARRNIELSGLMATVTGHAEQGDIVRVSGQFVPVDTDGRFVAQQIVSRKDGEMHVSITRNGKEVKSATQSFAAPKDDWFVVGQGDLTLGRSYGSGPASLVSGDSLAEGSYAIGRAAFYAKGVVGDDVRVTASVDTGETLVKDLFSNLDRKDPSQLLRRLNRDQYYPTYGDNSTLVEDAPTQGRFYLRVNKDDSQFVIGNFVTQVNGAELAQLDRGLFGALIDYNSKDSTSFGERRTQITAFASDPGTVPGREEFRGTGGSLYFMKRQDVSIGSERVRIEVRDRETGLILEIRDLYPQQDYDFDPFQGRITLVKPLASTVATDSAVREGSSTGNVPVLVVRYEYTPPVGDLDGYTIGGRGSGWLGDKVRFGVTAQRDTVEEAAQTLLGADVMVRVTAGSYFKAEVAQTDGPGFGQSNSVDGGLSFTDIVSPGTSVKAKAYRTEAAVNFAELAGKSGDLGTASVYFEHYDQGFSSSGRLTPSQTERWGVAMAAPVGEKSSISVKYDQLLSAGTGDSKTGTFDLVTGGAMGSANVTAKLGVRYEDRTPGLLYNSVQDGSRTDAALELEYAPMMKNWSLFGFGQATLDHDSTRNRNDRIGGGVKAELTEKLSLASEISGGSGGLGADVQLNHRYGEGSEAYIGYALFADRTDTGLDTQNIFTRSNRGNLTLGARHRFSDSLSIYGENRVGMGGTAPSLSRAYGLKFDPIEKLSITGSFENGRIDDATTGLFKRTAGSIGLGWQDENVKLGSSVEIRREKGNGRDQTVTLFRSDINYNVNPDWSALGRLNIARADNDSASIRAAEYTEAMAGFAYRPINNERLNALVRFTFFEDLGPAGQVTGSGEIESPKQQSKIANIDVNYDLTNWLTIGGKYGYRSGKVSLSRDSDIFVKSDAHLGVIRADFHADDHWDISLEGRGLWVELADDKRFGALGTVYRKLGNNVKVGVGYSLSDFSDDLTDQSYTSHGPFINLLGKF